MSDITPFTFPSTGQPVRTLLMEGEPWIVLRDVLDVLNVGNITDVLRSLDQDEFGTTEVVDSLGRRQSSYIVSEAGLYSLILRSRKPEAKAFKRWITHEVLPAIRKTGTYSLSQVSRKELARLVLEAEEAREEAENRAAFAEHQVLEMAPAVDAFDTFLSASNSDRLVGQVAKMLGWTATRLRNFLIAEGLVFARYRSCDGRREYNLRSGFEAHFGHKETIVFHDEVGACSHFTLYIKPRGMELIRKRIADRNASQQLVIEGGAL